VTNTPPPSQNKRQAPESISGNRNERGLHSAPARSPEKGRSAQKALPFRIAPPSQYAPGQTSIPSAPKVTFGGPTELRDTFYEPPPPPSYEQNGIEGDTDMDATMPPAPNPTRQNPRPPANPPFATFGAPEATQQAPPTPEILEPQCEATKLTADDPEIHAFNAQAIFDGMAPNVEREWKNRAAADPHGTILLYIARARDYSNASVARPLLRDALERLFPAAHPDCANPDQTKQRRILPPIKDEKSGATPILYLATGLSPNVAHTLIQGRGWSTRELSFFVIPFPPRPFTYVATFFQLLFDEDQKDELLAEMQACFTMVPAIRKAITTGAAEEMDNPDPIVVAKARAIMAGEPNAVAERIHTTLSRLTIRLTQLPRRDQNGKSHDEPAWVCECPCPCPSDPKSWTKAFEKAVICTAFGNSVHMAPFKCTYCQGIDHPLSQCNIPKKDAWFGSADEPEDDLPGQRADFSAVPPTSAHGESRGRGRGRGNRGGHAFSGNGRGRGGSRGFAQ
jgi:hypothetical protein